MGILRFCPGDFAAAWHGINDPTRFQAGGFLNLFTCIASAASWNTLKLCKLDLPNLHYSLFKSLVLMDSTAKLHQVSFLCATRFASHPPHPSKEKGFFHWGHRNFLSFQCFSMSFWFCGWSNYWIEWTWIFSLSFHHLDCLLISFLPLSSVAEVRCGDALLWDLAVVITRCAASATSAHHGNHVTSKHPTGLDISGLHCATRPTLQFLNVKRFKSNWIWIELIYVKSESIGHLLPTSRASSCQVLLAAFVVPWPAQDEPNSRTIRMDSNPVAESQLGTFNLHIQCCCNVDFGCWKWKEASARPQKS